MKEPYAITLGKRIRFFRERAGLTQEQLGRAIGYSGKAMISRIEGGTVSMDAEKIEVVAKALDINPHVLTNRSDLSEEELLILQDFLTVLTNKTRHLDSITALIHADTHE